MNPRTKDKALRLLVEFLTNPERFGCEIRKVKPDGASQIGGLLVKATQAMDAISVNESCMHHSLGAVLVLSIEGHRAVVTDGWTTHTVDKRECKRIL